MSTSADETWHNPRKAFATFSEFRKLWREYLGPRAKTTQLSEQQVNALGVFFLSHDAGDKLFALKSLIPAKNDWELEDFEKFYGDEEFHPTGAANRRIEFEKVAATCQGSQALLYAFGYWLLKPNDNPLAFRGIDVLKYITNLPGLPESIAKRPYSVPPLLLQALPDAPPPRPAP